MTEKIEQEIPKTMDEKRFEKAIRVFTDYINLAEQFIKIQPIFFDNAKIWWTWNFQTYCWKMIDETDLLNLVDDSLKIGLNTVNSAIKNQIIEALKRISRKNKPKEPKKTWIQFKNKIIDYETGEEFEATPEYFITNPIPWELGNSEETPTFDKLFREWVGEEYVPTLYEIIAFCLSSDYFLHRIFCFIGSGSNGKSTLINIMLKFLGSKNVTSTELDILLRSNFETAKLHKKLACMMTETNFNWLDKTSMLKKLTGQDLIGFEYKNKDLFDAHNYAKILVATNSLPRTSDKTKGFYRRWLIVEFPNEFTEKKDILKEIPEEEYNSLARKSIRILKELSQRRSFTNEGTIEERTANYEDKSNPLAKFIERYCETEPDYEVLGIEFQKKYLEYLKEKGLRRQSAKEIHHQLRDETYEVVRKSIRNDEGEYTTAQFVLGLRFRDQKNLKSYIKKEKPTIEEVKVEKETMTDMTDDLK